MSKSYAVQPWDITRLIPYAKNAKKHDPAKITAMAARMRDPKIGFTTVLLIEPDGTIISGHGRRLAALEAGLKFVPVSIFEGTKEEAAAERLADNQVVSTGMDMALLNEELSFLNGKVDLTFSGFTAKDLEFTLTPIETSFDETQFVDNIQQAVENQRDKNDERSAEIDASTAPLADAFGFRRMTVTQSRRTRAFMTQIEAETGKKGADALMVFFDNFGVAG